MNEKKIRQYYFENFNEGDLFVSPGRTITEYDVMAFAGISGDYNQLHTDKKYAESNQFGERVAHGLLGLSIVSGLAARLGLAEGTAEAFRSIEWKFLKPIRFGDTVYAYFLVKKKKRIPGKNTGYITLDVKVKNQKDEQIQRGKWAIIVRSEKR
jgi:acyl dehydratase